MSYLNLADGQLAASSGTLYTATAGQTVQVILANTGDTQQDVVLTVTRPGSSARRIAQATLEKDECCYVTGLPLGPSDVLAGYADSASTVDYLISLSGSPFAVTARTATGVPKANTEVELSVTEKFGLTQDGIVLSQLLEDIKHLLMKIA